MEGQLPREKWNTRPSVRKAIPERNISFVLKFNGDAQAADQRILDILVIIENRPIRPKKMEVNSVKHIRSKTAATRTQGGSEYVIPPDHNSPENFDLFTPQPPSKERSNRPSIFAEYPEITPACLFQLRGARRNRWTEWERWSVNNIQDEEGPVNEVPDEVVEVLDSNKRPASIVVDFVCLYNSKFPQISLSYFIYPFRFQILFCSGFRCLLLFGNT